MLYHHQQKILRDDPKRAGLFLGTGSGKSRIALSLARGNTLVVMPKTQYLDENWKREWLKMPIDMRTPKMPHFMSKEMFKRDHEYLPRYDTVIIDEAHTVLGVTPNYRWRNREVMPRASQIFEAVNAYLERTRPERIYLATATPARNPMAIWAAGKLLGRNMPSWEAWRRRFYAKLPMPGREVWQPKKDKKSKDALAMMVRSLGYVGRLQDWFDVPAQTDKYIHCELSPAQKKRMKELPLEFPDPIVLIGKQHQEEQGESKIEAIEDLLEEYGKVIVFARYLAQVEAIKTHFQGKTTVYTLTGATKDRREVIESAEKAEECLFIAQSQISTGYELPSFECVVFASMSYSYVDYVQARGRVLRANALKKNLFVHLHSGEIDDAIVKCMNDHVDFEERLYAEKRSKIPD